VGGVTKHPVLVAIAIVGLGVVAVPAASLARPCRTPACSRRDPKRARLRPDRRALRPGFNGPLILTGTIVTSTDRSG
jgi:RND superfamily putative drug exporter